MKSLWSVWRCQTKLSVNTKTITCALEPDDLRYRPRPETNNSEVGEILETAKLYRELLDKPLRSAIELTPNNADDFVFVTASDDRYFHRNMDAIGGVQKLFPRRTIIFYDLAGKKSPANIAKVKQPGASILSEPMKHHPLFQNFRTC